jgi:hypothetical protein
MRKRLLKKSLGLALMLLAAGAWAASDPPYLINFQGKLLNPVNNNPVNTTENMTFKIYADAAGTMALWGPEVQAVNITNGVFSVQLGAVTALSTGAFAGPAAYLGVFVQGDSGEMTPRPQLVASPYAVTAAHLMYQNDIGIYPGANATASTFTATGNLFVPFGISAGTGTFSGALTASSGTFTASGPTQYSIITTSGIEVQAGTVTVSGTVSAGFFIGNGAGLTNIPASDLSGVPVLANSNNIFTALSQTQFDIVIDSGIEMLQGTLMVVSSGGINAAGTGVNAATMTLQAIGNTQFDLTTSSGIQMNGGTLDINGSGGINAAGTGIVATTGTFAIVTATGTNSYSIFTSSGISMTAGTLSVTGAGASINVPGAGINSATHTLTAVGNSQYDLTTASGIFVNGAYPTGGGVVAPWFQGNGAALTNIPATGLTGVPVLANSNNIFTALSQTQFDIVIDSGIEMLQGTLMVVSSGGINAAGTGVNAATMTLQAIGNSQYDLTTSSGIQMNGGTLDINGSGGINAVGTGIVATTGTFAVVTATGVNNFSIVSSSGISMTGGTLSVTGSGGLVNSGGPETLSWAGGNALYDLVVSSGIQMNNGTLDINGVGGINAAGTGIVATTGTFAVVTATGVNNFSIVSSSGINVQAGTLLVQGAGEQITNAGTDYSLFTSSGISMTAGTLFVQGSGIQVTNAGTDYSIFTSSGISMTAGTLLVAGSGEINTVTGNGVFAITTSTGILLGGSGGAFSLQTTTAIHVGGGVGGVYSIVTSTGIQITGTGVLSVGLIYETTVCTALTTGCCVACPAGLNAIGGGCTENTAADAIEESFPANGASAAATLCSVGAVANGATSAHSWSCKANAGVAGIAYVICARIVQ